MIAAIDIGSCSVRLMLYRGEAVTPKEIDSTALGEGLALTGRISDEAAARTLAAVVRFADKARAAGAEKILIFGTEAMRAAANGERFRLEIERATGEKAEIISGETEARLGLLGAFDPGANIADELTAVDIGGASVEIVRGTRDKVTYARSLPLGAVRLLDLCGEQRGNIEKYVHEKVKDFGTFSDITAAAAIGGTATSLAAMAQKMQVYDPFSVHGFTLTRENLSRLTDEIFASTDRRRDFPILGERRAKIIGHGAIVLSEILLALHIDRITVSERDNLEGYIMLKSLKD